MKILHSLTGEVIFESAHPTMKQTVEAAISASTFLRGVDLNGANLRGADLSGAKLRFANLYGADLHGADLRWADLRWADLRWADLRWADLRGATLGGANLSGATLGGVNLSGVNLSGVNLSGVNLSGVNLSMPIEKIPIRDAICARVCATPENLEMSTWHTCETVHCLAGWAVTLHPQGRELEGILGTNAAATLIFHACEGEVPDFYSNNETAMKWLKNEN